MQHSIGIITEYEGKENTECKQKFEPILNNIFTGFDNIPNLSYYFITESNKDEVIKRIKEKKLIYIIHMTESGIHKLVTQIRKISKKYSNCVRIVVDSSFFGDKDYRTLGINGIKNDAIYLQKNKDDKRLLKRNIQLKKWRKTGDSVLFLAQQPNGSGCKPIGVEEVKKLYLDSLNYIIKNTNYNIIWRTHPNCREIPNCILKVIQNNKDRIKIIQGSKLRKLYHKQELYKSFDNVICSVAISTNATVSSIINGIPVISLSDKCIVRPYSNHKIEDINNLTYFNQKKIYQWLCDLSYTEWTFDEISTGLPISNIIKEYSNYNHI